MGAGMMLFPQMYQQLNQQPVQGVQQQAQPQAQKVMCPFCGGLNDYPYKFCRECGKPSPQMQNQMQQQQAPAQPAPAQPAGGAAAGGAFKRCPYCGEDLSMLKKTPKFCPYCSEELS